MHVIIIIEQRGHEFEGEQEGHVGEFGGKKRMIDDVTKISKTNE